MKKVLRVFLSMTIAASMLAGCGGTNTGGSSDQQSKPQESVAAESAAESAVKVESAASTANETVAGAADGELQPLAGVPGYAIGGLKPAEDLDNPEELTEEDTENLDRAMRAYTPPADSLLINNATTYHYYESMGKDAQTLYDAMLMCATDPTNVDNVVAATISVDPTSTDFISVLQLAYHGLLYDHPELFWLYNGSEADLSFGTPYTQPGNGTYMVYIYFKEPFDGFEDMMNNFNDAVDNFLADIDTSKSDEVIAKDIHDKLIQTVSYNIPLMEDNTPAGLKNLAHTAYGALVKDSSGNPNSAVCDGYSQAYVYLLEQCGIEATVIVGNAGNTMEDAGGHAWSAVKLGNDWYEVDSTWDDAGTIDVAVDGIKESNPLEYSYYFEALSDQEYRNKLEHALCYVTTKQISNYEPDDYYIYTTKDKKYQLTLASSSVRKRANETTGLEPYAPLMELAPIAEGTAFSLR